MSIVAYTGLPGSGKSYGVVEHVIIPACDAGRRVVTNIPLAVDQIKKDYPLASIESFRTDDIDDGWFQETDLKGVVFVIDEVWRLWPSGQKAAQTAEGHRSFLAEHRHLVGGDGYTTEIVLVTQDLSQIANFARQLVEETYRAQKLSALGQSKSYRVDVYTGAVTGQKPPVGQRLRQFFGKYEKRVFQYYSSHTMGGGKIGSESKVDKRGNVLRSAPILVGLPLALVLVVCGVYFAASTFSAGGGLMGGVAKTEPLLSAPPVPELEQRFERAKTERVNSQVNVDPVRIDTGPRFSQSLRLVGLIALGETSFAVISDQSGRYRRIDAGDCYQNYGDPVCKYEGELVTQYTGKATQNAVMGDAANRATSYAPVKSSF